MSKNLKYGVASSYKVENFVVELSIQRKIHIT